MPEAQIIYGGTGACSPESFLNFQVSEMIFPAFWVVLSEVLREIQSHAVILILEDKK